MYRLNAACRIWHCRWHEHVYFYVRDSALQLCTCLRRLSRQAPCLWSLLCLTTPPPPPRRHQECCPGSAYSIAADCTPSASVGATAFPSVNTVDSNGDGVASSVSVNGTIAIADHIGLHDPPAAADDVFVSVGIPSTSATESVAGTADGKGQGEGAAEGSELHTRSESSVAQPVDAAAAGGAGGEGDTGAACEVNRVNTTPSAETEAYGRFEHHAVSASAPEPQSPPRVGSASKVVREGSMPSTDVE